MNQDNRQLREADLEAPARLREALKQLHHRSAAVPGEVDRALVKEARLQMQRVRNRGGVTGHTGRLPRVSVRFLAELVEGLADRLSPKGAMVWSTAAVALVAVVVGVWLAVQPQPGDLAQDFNHDGTVDMLDAFTLARQLQEGQAWGADLNGDGRVDDRDVQELASRAVHLDQGRSS